MGLAAAALAVMVVAGCGASGSASRPRSATTGASRVSATQSRRSAAHPDSGAGRHTGYAVGERVLTFVDHSRLIRLPGRRPEPRRLVTVVRYPKHTPGPVPLVVFGHGFASTPAYYFRLLNAWAAAGYVVAAPVFPLGSARAPGGPNEADIVNQPRDMSFVITRLLAASADRGSPLAGLIDRRRIAVSGQSDGGETALAVAYYRSYLDRRVIAAVILSGARLPGTVRPDFPQPSPPLLATQGTADTINRPRFTYDFFRVAPRPKYLLQLLGAGHLPPYTYQQPQLSIVERVTIAFLDRYLAGLPDASRRLTRAGNVPGVSVLDARP